MYKRKSRSISSSTQKVRSSQRIPGMTVHQRNEDGREARFPSVSPTTKNWTVMENDSSSWDRNSRATSSSWPGEMEEATTRKILKLWYAIEKEIYGENEDDQEIHREEKKDTDFSNEECTQWKNQLVHLRLVGKNFAKDGENEISKSSSSRPRTSEDRFGEEIFIEDSVFRSDLSDDSKRRRFYEDQRDVFEQILEYVVAEIGKKSKEKNEESLSKDLDEMLRITPAPTYSGRRWNNGRNKRENGESRRTSANENRVALNSENFVEKNQTEGDEKIDEDEPKAARNKLGTVFNEKIVVSPVPFILSTRESFTTLRTTPISFQARNFKVSSSEGLGRYMNSASTTNSGKRIAPSRTSQIHSAWQAPVCPTVWPKNIKLAPIDPARLPSSKNRSALDSMAALPHKNRNSLSPILRPIKPSSRNESTEGLEIQGKQIVRSPKKSLQRTNWDGSPRIVKNTRKPRITKR